MRVRGGILVFPGTNCDYDVFWALKILEFEPSFVWYNERFDIKKYDFIVLPGGFSFGDYLRAGAIASYSPSMNSVEEFAEKGKPVIGICNGFQILCERKLLPGALLRNVNLKFICQFVELQVVDNETPFTLLFEKGEKIKLPIAHKYGNYFFRDEDNPQVVLRYLENLNGSKMEIAGITNKKKNVFGLMPHPERAVEGILGSEDGRKFFLSLKKWFKE